MAAFDAQLVPTARPARPLLWLGVLAALAALVAVLTVLRPAALQAPEPVATLPAQRPEAVVVQAALLGQGIALGWLTVTSHWLLTGALVPASDTLPITRRFCEFLPPRNRPMRPIAAEIRDWIIVQMRNEVTAIDRQYPRLGLMSACY